MINYHNRRQANRFFVWVDSCTRARASMLWIKCTLRRTAHIKLRNALRSVTMSRVSRNRKHFLHRVDRMKIVCVNSINSLSSDACPSFNSVDGAAPLAHLSGHDTFAYIIASQRNVIHPGNQRDELGISPLTTYTYVIVIKINWTLFGDVGTPGIRHRSGYRIWRVRDFSKAWNFVSLAGIRPVFGGQLLLLFLSIISIATFSAVSVRINWRRRILQVKTTIPNSPHVSFVSLSLSVWFSDGFFLWFSYLKCTREPLAIDSCQV